MGFKKIFVLGLLLIGCIASDSYMMEPKSDKQLIERLRGTSVMYSFNKDFLNQTLIPALEKISNETVFGELYDYIYRLSTAERVNTWLDRDDWYKFIEKVEEQGEKNEQNETVYNRICSLKGLMHSLTDDLDYEESNDYWIDLKNALRYRLVEKMFKRLLDRLKNPPDESSDTDMKNWKEFLTEYKKIKNPPSKLKNAVDFAKNIITKQKELSEEEMQKIRENVIDLDFEEWLIDAKERLREAERIRRIARAAGDKNKEKILEELKNLKSMDGYFLVNTIISPNAWQRDFLQPFNYLNLEILASICDVLRRSSGASRAEDVLSHLPLPYFLAFKMNLDEKVRTKSGEPAFLGEVYGVEEILYYKFLRIPERLHDYPIEPNFIDPNYWKSYLYEWLTYLAYSNVMNDLVIKHLKVFDNALDSKEIRVDDIIQYWQRFKKYFDKVKQEKWTAQNLIDLVNEVNQKVQAGPAPQKTGEEEMRRLAEEKKLEEQKKQEAAKAAAEQARIQAEMAKQEQLLREQAAYQAKIKAEIEAAAKQRSMEEQARQMAEKERQRLAQEERRKAEIAEAVKTRDRLGASLNEKITEKVKKTSEVNRLKRELGSLKDQTKRAELEKRIETETNNIKKIWKEAQDIQEALYQIELLLFQYNKN